MKYAKFIALLFLELLLFLVRIALVPVACVVLVFLAFLIPMLETASDIWERLSDPTKGPKL